MPPKKKHRTASSTPSNDPPATAAARTSRRANNESPRPAPIRTTRSRTRSASVASTSAASAAPRSSRRQPSTQGSTKPTLVKPSSSSDRRVKSSSRESSVLVENPASNVELWIDIPPVPQHILKQDPGASFVKPINLDAFKAKGKYKLASHGLVLYVDQIPTSDPFYLSKQDLEDDQDDFTFVALKPPRKRASGSSSDSTLSQPNHHNDSSNLREEPPSPTRIELLPDSNDQFEKAAESTSQLSDRVANSSKATNGHVLPASEPLNEPAQDRQRAASAQPHLLEDMFLVDTNNSSQLHRTKASTGMIRYHSEDVPRPEQVSNSQFASQTSGTSPLFFENQDEEEDELEDNHTDEKPARVPVKRSAPTTAPTQGSTIYAPYIKTSPPPASSSAHYSSKPSSSRSQQDSTDKLKRSLPPAPPNRSVEPQIKKRKMARFPPPKLGSQKSSTKKSSDDELEQEDDVDDLQNLKSQINDDALSRSSGSRQKQEYRSKLAKLASARKKLHGERDLSDGSDEDEDDRAGRVGKQADRISPRSGAASRKSPTVYEVSSSSSSSSSSSYDSSDSSDSDSDSDSSRDFIVDDDKIEYDEGHRPSRSSHQSSKTKTKLNKQRTDAGNGRVDADGRIRLPAVRRSQAGTSNGSILAQHGLVSSQKKSIDEMCMDWIEWAVVRVLLSWSSISAADRERLDRNRAAIKSRLRSTEESVGSVAMRRQFKWYLVNYPKIEVQALFSDDLERYGSLIKVGCGTCHRKSQKTSHLVRFEGKRYNQKTLAPLRSKEHDRSKEEEDSEVSSSEDSDSEDSSTSDRSNENESWCERAEDDKGRPAFRFYVGSACAQRARVMHQLHHWEWTTMQTLGKHPAIRSVRRNIVDHDGYGLDGREGPGEQEVRFVIDEMIDPTSRVSGSGPSELDRLKRRVKSLIAQALEVNKTR